MHSLSQECRATSDDDRWYFGIEKPSCSSDVTVAEQAVADNRSSRPIGERRLLVGCFVVGMLGIVILLTIVAVTSNGLGLARSLKV